MRAARARGRPCRSRRARPRRPRRPGARTRRASRPAPRGSAARSKSMRSSCCWWPITRSFTVVESSRSRCSEAITRSRSSRSSSERARPRPRPPPRAASRAPPSAVMLRATLAAPPGRSSVRSRAPPAPAPRARCGSRRRTSSGRASRRPPRARGAPENSGSVLMSLDRPIGMVLEARARAPPRARRGCGRRRSPALAARLAARRSRGCGRPSTRSRSPARRRPATRLHRRLRGEAPRAGVAAS